VRAGTSPRAVPRVSASSSSTGTAAAPPCSSRRCRDCPCSSSLASARPSGSAGTAPSPSAPRRRCLDARSPWPPLVFPRSVCLSGLHPCP
jgi:hypothetical protein